jgi:hypothetical protein
MSSMSSKQGNVSIYISTICIIPDRREGLVMQMKKLVISMATSDALTSLPSDTPNLLVFNGAGRLP